MSLGTWDPNLEASDGAHLLQPALLSRLISYDRDAQLMRLAELLSDADKQRLAGLMKLDLAVWQAAIEPLDDAALLHLLRFFCVAENLPGWEAGATSPVIPLAGALRRRGHRLDKPLLQWIREVNDNRFLPYGPL
jgi:hypothetical protein